MNILWKSSEKKPQEGDIKIMKNGDMFIRGNRVVVDRGRRSYVLSNNRYVMVWYPFVTKPDAVEPMGLNDRRKEYLEKGVSLFRAHSATTVRKTTTVTLDLTVEADRKRYMSYFKCSTISDGVTKVTLSVYV
ncbi:hypothetical protein OTK49_01530 [Vibrio coralliirubri]|uniref:hypothetical protein n=1 Tax=Vibrio coralliirubri TaxID=1516159 RepID=UPI002284C22B|nr:hypothetical protein [Vibrio coralliirubri]MCY9861206.1 hypothetical protein [Vibrio coralliirubri]